MESTELTKNVPTNHANSIGEAIRLATNQNSEAAKMAQKIIAGMKNSMIEPTCNSSISEKDILANV